MLSIKEKIIIFGKFNAFMVRISKVNGIVFVDNLNI